MIVIIIIIILYSLGIITIGVLIGVINSQNVQIPNTKVISPLVASQELIDYVTSSSEEMPDSEYLVNVVDEELDINILLQYNTTNLDTVYHSNQINAFSKNIICDFKNNQSILNYTPNTQCYI